MQMFHNLFLPVRAHICGYVDLYAILFSNLYSIFKFFQCIGVLSHTKHAECRDCHRGNSHLRRSLHRIVNGLPALLPLRSEIRELYKPLMI